MARSCPECGGALAPKADNSEMTSAPDRFYCSECQIEFATDATGFLSEFGP